MRNESRFLAALVAGFLTAISVYLGLVWWQAGAATADTYWCYEINKKKLQIAAQINAPKLLLVGGSATLFGLKAQQVEQALRVPTVNMGTHAALGLPYLLRLTRRAARPGDTVLLALEYEMYEQGNNVSQWADDVFVSFMLARDPEYFRQLPWCDQFRLSLGVSFPRLWTGMKHRLFPQPPPTFPGYFAYDPRNVDDRGDMVGHTEERRPQAGPHKFKPCDVLARGLADPAPGFPVINSFLQWAKSQDIHVLVTYPSICQDPEYDRPCARQTIATIRQFYAYLGVPTVATFEESLVPFAACFDTGYHLTEQSAQQHTKQLLVHLRRHFNKPADSADPDVL